MALIRFKEDDEWKTWEPKKPVAAKSRKATVPGRRMMYGPGGGAPMRGAGEVMAPAETRRRAQAPVTVTRGTASSRPPGTLPERGLTIEDIDRAREEIRMMAARQRAPVLQTPAIPRRPTVAQGARRQW